VSQVGQLAVAVAGGESRVSHVGQVLVGVAGEDRSGSCPTWAAATRGGRRARGPLPRGSQARLPCPTWANIDRSAPGRPSSLPIRVPRGPRSLRPPRLGRQAVRSRVPRGPRSLRPPRLGRQAVRSRVPRGPRSCYDPHDIPVSHVGQRRARVAPCAKGREETPPTFRVLSISLRSSVRMWNTIFATWSCPRWASSRWRSLGASRECPTWARISWNMGGLGVPPASTGGSRPRRRTVVGPAVSRTGAPVSHVGQPCWLGSATDVEPPDPCPTWAKVVASASLRPPSRSLRVPREAAWGAARR
jgi:hypothetical protein